ncbi:IS701 family transposase, partial [Belliella sp. DSM 111904]
SSLLSGSGETALLIDEVGFRKKGRHSACVGRQYLGCLGKQDNGQVAVVGGLSSGSHYCPVDVELFMPKSWDCDLQRRKNAGIPDHIAHRSKTDMALEMILDLQSRGISFDYVGFDSLYGSSSQLIGRLDKAKIPFIGDVRENINVYLSEPKFAIPAAEKGKRGRKPKLLKADIQTVSLKEHMETLQSEEFTEIAFRDGTKQKIRALFHQKDVWVKTDDHVCKALKLQLIIRKDIDGTTKYSFCNMHEDTLTKIAQRQGQRVFVERIFEEGKNQIGLGDYQVRSWEGFHKHMTLCFMAFYYIALQKVNYDETLPLTAPVIRKLVASTISSRWENLESTMDYCLKHLYAYRRQIQRNLNRSPET